MNKAISFTLSVIAFFIWVYGYAVVGAVARIPDASEIAQRHATNTWMWCDAVAKSIFILAFTTITTGYYREWLAFVFTLSINNLLDELFFDPLHLGLNEIFIALCFAVYFTYKITRALYAVKQ